MADAFFAVAPADVASEHVTIRDPLRPIEVWQLADAHFAFDSSVLLPSMTEDLAELIGLVRANPGAPLAIFGHADPTGRDDYNKALAGRRATSLYAFLTHRVDLCERLYANPMGADDWARDKLAARVMQNHLDPSAALPAHPPFSQYIESVAVDPQGKSFVLPASAFLGHGRDAGGKADYQGCGEFNPLLMFSAEEAQRFARSDQQAARDAANATNRRVTVVLFAAGTEIPLDKWPCPRATEGATQCRKRFWSDAAARRTFQARHREHPESDDTFACRFYDRLTNEQLGAARMVVHVQLHDWLLVPCADTSYVVHAENMRDRRGRTNGEGWLSFSAPPAAQTVRITYTPKDTDVLLDVTVNVPPPSAPSDERYLAHIRNAGFGGTEDDVHTLVSRFQAAHRKLQLTGRLDDPTRAAIDAMVAGTLADAIGRDDG
jgi:outer membrane protein OmpA-like peptidoglycan-associated protein